MVWQNNQFQVVRKQPLSQISTVACNQQLVAVGQQDGKVFLLDYQLQIVQKITDYGQKVTALTFDKVVPTILHVANSNQLTSYDVKAQVQRLKNRPQSAIITGLQQVNFGRYELVAACLDGTLKFFDFDMAEAVQVTKMPPGCIVSKKLFINIVEDKLVAGGCYLDADEVLLTMQCQQHGWEPVGSFLSNGVVISSISADHEQVQITGFGGEIAVYGW